MPLVTGGQIVGEEPLDAARERHHQARAELPLEALKMSRGEPVIPTVYSEGTRMSPLDEARGTTPLAPRKGRVRALIVVVYVQQDFCEGLDWPSPAGPRGDPDRRPVAARPYLRPRWWRPGTTTSIRVPTSRRHRTSSTPGRGTARSARRGVDFHPHLTFRDFGAVFDKGEYAAAYSGFEGHSAEGAVWPTGCGDHGVDQVDVCGIATDYCVRATALDAARAGFATTVLLDLTAAVAPDRLTPRWPSSPRQVSGPDLSSTRSPIG